MLIEHVARYVELHRRLGYKYVDQERTLLNYTAFASSEGDIWIRSDRVIEWCRQAASVDRARRKLATVRHFAEFLHAEDERHEVPPRHAFGRMTKARPSPHLLTREQVRQLMNAALRARPAGTITPLTWHYLFGLLAVTGLRVSEAVALRLTDITPDGLIVRDSKFGKSRLLPLHDSTHAALDKYLAVRMRVFRSNDHLFVLATGKPPAVGTAYGAFVRLLRQLGIRGEWGTPGPRLHDLRHTFCAWSLEGMQLGDEGGRSMLALSTYLGHSCIESTYWYLKATPVLLRRISKMAEHAQTGRSQQ